MSKQSLIPTTIVDKNGVTTTRWKRPDSSGASSKSITPPHLPSRPQPTFNDFLCSGNEVANGFNKALQNSYLGEAAKEKMIRQLKPESIETLTEMYEGRYELLEQTYTYCVSSMDSTTLNNAAALREAWDECGVNEALRAARYPDAVAGLQWFSSTHEEFSADNPAEVEIGVALVKANANLPSPYASMMTQNNYAMRYLTDRNLIDLIRRNPQDVRRIGKLLIERQITVRTPDDAKVVEELLKGSAASALDEGML